MSSCLYLAVALERKSHTFECMCSKPTALRKLQHSRACAYILLPRKFCPDIQKHRGDVCLPVWFAWQIKMRTEAGAENRCCSHITTDIKALVSWLLSISFRDILSIASSMSIHLRISVLADFPTHTYLSPGLPDGFLLSLKAALCMTAVVQFLGLLLGSLSENICVCSGKVMADHCNCCLGL